MSVHQDKSTGRWYVNYKRKLYRRDFNNNQFQTKTQARNFEVLLKSRFGSVTDITFNELVTVFLDHKKQRLQKDSYAETERSIKVIAAPHIPNKHITQFTPKDFLVFEKAMLLSSYSHGYKNKVISTLKSAFEFAVKYYGLENNPTRFIDKAKPTHAETQKRLKKQFQTWTVETFSAFYNAIKETISECQNDQDMYLWRCVAIFYLLSFDLGTRMSETNGLLVSDYDPTTFKISIRQQVNDKDGYKLKQLKTPSSIRVIDISQFAAKELDAHIEYFKSLSVFNESCFLCGGYKPLTPETLKRKKDLIISKYNISPRITIHEFRHSHATNLIDAGADITAVSRRLGHASTAITERVYTHVLDKKRTKLAQINDEIYKNIQ